MQPEKTVSILFIYDKFKITEEHLVAQAYGISYLRVQVRRITRSKAARATV